MTQYIALKGGEMELGGVPEIVKLLPLGHVKSAQGDFEVDAESYRAMREQMERRGLALVIDYEHQTLKDVEAPAAGWIKELLLQQDAIAAKVEWTPRGRQYLENKEYRYLSPVVVVRKGDHKAVVLHSAALTNTPAIDNMFAVVNSLDIKDLIKGGDTGMDEFLKKLAALLGLGDDTTEDQVMEAVGKALEAAKAAPMEAKLEKGDKIVENKIVCGLLGLQPGAKTEDAAAAIMALKAPAAKESEELKALKEKIERREAGEAVEKALKAGKLTAAQKDWALAYALKDPAGFAAFVDKAPAAVPVGEMELEGEVKANKAKADEATLAVCKMMGISRDDLDKYGKDDE